jgi:hypothetical protein
MAKLNNRENQNIPQHVQGGILERLKKLERFRDDMLRAMNQTFTIVDQRETQTEEVLRAVINLLGRETVEKETRRLKIEELESKSLQEKATFDAAKEAGKVFATERVTEKSVIIGTEVNKDGEQLFPTRVQLFFPQLPIDYQKCYLGAAAGDVVVTPTGSKFTIAETYEVLVKAESATDTAPAAGGHSLVAHPTEYVVPVSGDEPVSDDVSKQLVDDLVAAAENTSESN